MLALNIDRSSTIEALLFIAVFNFLNLGCQTHRSNISENFNGVEFKYNTPWKFNKKEKTELLNLAASCGMTNIETVITYYMVPTSLIDIKVKEREVITGREVRYRELTVDLPKWNPRREIPPEVVKQKSKRFQVIGDTLHTFALLSFKNSVFRVRVDPSIPPLVAEQILGKFLKMEVDFDRNAIAYKNDLAEDLANAKPTSIRKESQDNYSITFWRKASGSRYIFRRDEKSGAIRVTVWGRLLSDANSF